MALKDTETKINKALQEGKLGNIVDPVRLERDSTFQFNCHPGVPCFTRCCRNMDIILTPYDIIRLKGRLGLTADMFLELYAQPELLSQTRLPVARLKMLKDKNGRCPFVSPEGCQVYTDRPVCCRYYPIGMASLIQMESKAGQEEEFFFLVKEEHCKGFAEPDEWTVDSWRADQEADLYDSMNRGWMELLLRKKSFGEESEIPEKGRQLFYMVTTNMDRFRNYVFGSRFLDTYDVDIKTLHEIREKDDALMQFGFEYLKHAIFGGESDVVRLKEAVLKQAVKRIAKAKRKQNKRLKRLKSVRR